MSAIREWFGYYNAMFSYIEDQFGENELDRYFDFLVSDAHTALTDYFSKGGYEDIAKHYVTNFCKDGDENSASYTVTDHDLTILVKCPGFYYPIPTESDKRKCGPMLCKGCRMLNAKILDRAGYELDINEDGKGNCTWNITKRG